MNILIAENAYGLGKSAGMAAAQAIRDTIELRGKANIILATGTSQFGTLNQLVSEDVDWSKVVMFHLDEYIGLPIIHQASFRKYLQEKFISKVTPLNAVYLINGELDPQIECDRLGKIIGTHPIDVALVGVGENGHLAFNDPPADFTTEKPYIIVDLDEPCRKQQLGEGWFKSLEDVPRQAISMSVKQILKSKTIICSVPDNRKAMAIKNTIERKISNLYPASILQSHGDCWVYLDKNSAAQLSKNISESVTQPGLGFSGS